MSFDSIPPTNEAGGYCTYVFQTKREEKKGLCWKLLYYNLIFLQCSKESSSTYHGTCMVYIYLLSSCFSILIIVLTYLLCTTGIAIIGKEKGVIDVWLLSFVSVSILSSLLYSFCQLLNCCIISTKLFLLYSGPSWSSMVDPHICSRCLFYCFLIWWWHTAPTYVLVVIVVGFLLLFNSVVVVFLLFYLPISWM